MIWLPFRVTSGTEFRTAYEIGKLGAATVMVPSVSIKIRQRRKGEPRVVKRVLAPGYVFAAYHGYESWAASLPAVRLVKGVIGGLKVAGRYVTLTPMDIRALQAMAVHAAEPDEAESGLKPGDRLSIKRGLYANLSAVVDRLDGADVVAIVDMFGRPNEVRIPADQVEVEAA